MIMRRVKSTFYKIWTLFDNGGYNGTVFFSVFSFPELSEDYYALLGFSYLLKAQLCFGGVGGF